MSGESEERWILSGSCVKDKDDVRRQDETEVSPTYCMQGHWAGALESPPSSLSWWLVQQQCAGAGMESL